MEYMIMHDMMTNQVGGKCRTGPECMFHPRLPLVIRSPRHCHHEITKTTTTKSTVTMIVMVMCNDGDDDSGGDL